MSKIIIKNLKKTFGNNKVINNFNVNIEDGEFIRVLAKNSYNNK